MQIFFFHLNLLPPYFIRLQGIIYKFAGANERDLQDGEELYEDCGHVCL